MSTDGKFSLEEILAEERARSSEAQPAEEQRTELPVEEVKVEIPLEESVAEEAEAVPAAAEEEKTVPEQQTASQPEEKKFVVALSEEQLNGDVAEGEAANTDGKADKKSKKEKKEKKGFFARRREKREMKKKQAQFNEAEDMYYGIQLKPIDEFTRGFDATGEISLEQEGFNKLFDENTTELDDEVAKNFERLQKERRRRVAEAVENVGVNIDEVEDELGIVAPVPVSAFAGDPYAKQHGIENGTEDEALPDFQKAMLQDAQTRTMEIKLDVINDSVEVQQAKIMPEVSEDAVRAVLETVQEEPETVAAETEEAQFTDVSSFSEEKIAEMDAVKPDVPQVVDFAQVKAEAEAAAAETEEEEEPVKISLPVNDITEYRTRDLPVHIINADVLQSALLSEARVYSEDGKKAGDLKLRLRDTAEETDAAVEESGEQLDDYTSPADAKSIAHDLRTTMRQLSIRMLATGVSAVVLILASVICENGFKPGNTELSGAIGYAVVSLIFLAIAMGFCAKMISNGIRSLLALRANSDSAAAVASAAVMVQTVCAFLYMDALAAGKFHLYAGVAAAILFLNTLGKLTMMRRIHSNFRFVASRENKYAVRIYDDYNTSLRMAGSAVVSQPVIAYQQKVDFLKRFLQISYEPDPAETVSQAMAPIGLLSSLILCVASLVVTKDPAVSIGVLAAACCVCTAVMNMLAVNLPVSRLTRRLRRSGAMVASFEGIQRMSAVNAVLVDSEELFPSGTVVINGIKPLSESMLEDAVLDAGVLTQKVGGPLRGVFEQVLNEYEGELPEVTTAHFETGNGIVGMVDGKEVLIGSRALLVAHDVEMPDPAMESRYLTGNRQVVYVAEEGVACAMFILTYNADRKKKAEIQELENNGVALLVRTTDANLTPEFVSRMFGIDHSAVRVIGADTDEACDALLREPAGRVDAYTATKGRADSMMSIVSACIGEKKNIGFIVAMQNAAVIIGFILVAFLTFISGIQQVSTVTLLIYELFWVAAAVILPKLKQKIK